jgi:arylsulfatase A-like enzyme
VLREGLLARGLDRNTIWIVFGDHGEAFGQHPGNYGHTFVVYDENVRVPLVIAAPGVFEGQRRVARTVSLVDVAPTILDRLGIAAPGRHQGRSALDGTPRMALFSTDYSLPLAGLGDGSWKVIEDMSSGRTQLFDLTRDATEAHDVALVHADRAREYAATLKAWAAAQKAYVLASY